MKPVIVSTTVSVELAEKEYGSGSASFMNMTAKFPEEGLPLESIDEMVEQGLDMYFTAWKTLITSRYATGALGGTEYKEWMTKATQRIEKAKKFLKAEQNGQSNY